MNLPIWCERGQSRRYRTKLQVVWSIGRKGSDWQFVIEAGREFESSVPWFLTWLLDPDDPRFLLPALIHDVLLETGYRRFFAAGEWYDAALSQGGPRRFTFWAAIGVAIYTNHPRGKRA